MTEKKQPYTFKIYRSNKVGGSKAYVWYEDTEYGLAETLETAKGLAITVSDETRPITRIVIELV